MIKQKTYILIVIMLLATTVAMAQNQFRRIDTIMKLGKAGYKVLCTNKNEAKNNVSITPVGFSSGARDASFEISGRLLNTEVDDLNNDLFPDLVLYVYPPNEKQMGAVIGITSINNESIAPIVFPDIANDPKLRVGYVGYDSFMLMEGSLMRKFPVYKVDSVSSVPTGKYRQIQYSVVTGERETLKFKAVRSYEFAKQ